MHFNLFVMDTGHHEASRRLPGSDPAPAVPGACTGHMLSLAPRC